MAKSTRSAKSARPRRRAKRNIDRGRVYIHSTFNNTIITVTDAAGNVIAWNSAGSQGMRGARKGTAFAAQIASEAAAAAAKEQGMRTVEVYVKGVGAGRESAIRALGTADLEVTLIKDRTPLPHNGCRPPKKRRV